MANFEGKDRRESTLKKVLPEYGFKNLDEARELCLSKGIDVDNGIETILISALLPTASTTLFSTRFTVNTNLLLVLRILFLISSMELFTAT